MKYVIALKPANGVAEITNFEFTSKKKALEFKTAHDHLLSGTECKVYKATGRALNRTYEEVA